MTPAIDVTSVVQNATQQARQQLESMPAMAKALGAAASALNGMPHLMMQKQLELVQSHMALAVSMMEKMTGKEGVAPVAEPEKGDRRFGHADWNLPMFDWLKQTYLINTSWMKDVVQAADGLDAKTKHQAEFFTTMLSDAMSPSNNPFTNPEVLAKAKETNGESLRKGLENWLSDMGKGSGGISMTDMSKFEVGKNIACTPGKVVMRNHLIELLEYAPQTKEVHATPILISPPWINRYYILDLSPANSLVNYLVGKGFRVFMISWKNPDASYRDVGFEQYLQDGLLEAVTAVREICGVEKINMAGYCIGGTLLATGLGYLAAAKKDVVQSATFFTTMTDFTNPGDLGVFIDEAQLAKLDADMYAKGYLDGAEMAGTFSALRSAELYWGFVVSQYLMGEQPTAFDILYWNAKATKMPCAMHSWYLRELYLHNRLVKNQVKLLGQTIDLGKISCPLYMVGAQNDHITPWASCYAGLTRMGSKDKRFALTKAGHVAGVCNPPTPEGKPVKRSYMVGSASAPTAEAWSSSAKTEADSWWPDWTGWLAGQSGKLEAAPKSQGGKGYKVLGDAPGSYVHE